MLIVIILLFLFGFIIYIRHKSNYTYEDNIENSWHNFNEFRVLQIIIFNVFYIGVIINYKYVFKT